MLAFFNVVAFAQNSPKVEVNGNDVGSWFSQNWIWVVAVFAILLIVLLFSGGTRNNRTTVVHKNDGLGNRTTTTTQTEES